MAGLSDSEWIKAQREIALQRLREKDSSMAKDFLEHGEASERVDRMFSSPEGLAVLTWDRLDKELYWRAMHALKDLVKASPDLQLDKRRMTEIMVRQVMQGKQVANPIPVFYDVWQKIGREGSPLAEFVNEGHIRSAVNEGFWTSLTTTTIPTKDVPAGDTLREIIVFPGFFEVFDYKEGARRARSMPRLGEIRSLGVWRHYSRWLLVQDLVNSHYLPHEKRVEVGANLSGPLVRELLGTCTDNYELTGLASVLLSSDYVGTETMQATLKNILEHQLGEAFSALNDDYWSSDVLKRVWRSLRQETREEVAAQVWDRLKGRADPLKVYPAAQIYLPNWAYQDKVASLRKRILDGEKFDVWLLSQWVDQQIESKVDGPSHGRVRNSSLGRYMGMKPRPKVADVEALYDLLERGGLGEGASLHEVRAFIFADLLCKNRPRLASQAVLVYDFGIGPWDQRPKIFPISHRDKFFGGLEKYAESHGIIRVAEDSLTPEAVYPIFNCVPYIMKIREDLFEVVKK